MKISTRQIAAFVAVADQENFTRAARLLNISQPSLSALVKELESVLGAPVFDRTTRGVALSKVGQALLPIARRIHGDIDLMLTTSTDLSQLQQGTVRVACSNVIATSQLLPMASRFRAQFPRIKIDIVDAVEQSLADLVRSSSVDFAIASEIDPEPRIVQKRIGEDRLAAYVPAEHPLARQDRVAWSDLDDEPLVLLNKGSPLRQLVDRTAGRLGMWLSVEYEVSFGTTALALADRGLAIAILPTNALQPNASYGCLRKALIKPFVPRRVVIMSLARRTLSPAAESFQKLCSKDFSINFEKELQPD